MLATKAKQSTANSQPQKTQELNLEFTTAQKANGHIAHAYINNTRQCSTYIHIHTTHKQRAHNSYSTFQRTNAAKNHCGIYLGFLQFVIQLLYSVEKGILFLFHFLSPPFSGRLTRTTSACCSVDRNVPYCFSFFFIAKKRTLPGN